MGAVLSIHRSFFYTQKAADICGVSQKLEIPNSWSKFLKRFYNDKTELTEKLIKIICP